MASPVSAEVEAFLFAAEGLEEKASQALREADPEVQKAVLARGDLTGARNPSAALLGRIRKATGGGGGATVNVDAFIAENSPLDERAQEALRTAPGWVQEGVVAGGEVTNARNPSAALISRINSVQTGGGGWGGDPWGGAWGGKGGWGAADPWTVGFQMGFGGKGWDKGWGKGWGGGGGSWGGGGGGGGSWGETPARKGPVTLGSAGTVHYLTVPPTSALVQKGMSAEVVAVEYDKTNTVFQSAAHILGDLLDAEPKEVCSFDFDPDAAVFPEVAQAWTNAGNEQSCFMISQCPSMGKWAVGVAPGWKNAERAGKLALAVAIAHGTPQLQMLFNTFPEFHDFCKSAGLVEGAQPQSAGLVWSPPEATLMGGKGGKDFEYPEQVTTRYLLSDLPELASEDEVRSYFSVFAQIEEVTVRKSETSGKITGSVKFAAPTAELRDQMLKDVSHEILGQKIKVETYKMQKKAKPGWAAKKALESAKWFAEKKAKGKGWFPGYMPY